MPRHNTITIKESIIDLQRGFFLLPAFQREFVWKHEQVEMLFDSLMRGYPIGSMLFWKLSKNVQNKYHFYRLLNNYTEKYKVRGEEIKSIIGESDYAILDGQQRLTALNIGLCGTYAYRKKYAWSVNNENNYPTRRLYLDISRIYNEGESGKKYRFEFLANHEDDIFTDKDLLWLRVGMILNCDKDTRRAFARKHQLTYEQSDILDDLWDLIWEKDVISYYEETTDDPDVAVEVFSRINSGGTRLNIADILMALIVANWKSHEARNEIGGLVGSVNAMGFNISHEYVLKSFLYLHNLDIRFKIINFNNDFICKLEEKWPAIKEAILNLFILLKQYGLNHNTLTSYHATLPILQYIYQRGIYYNFTSSVTHSNDRAIIKRWLMKTLLLRTFGYKSDGMLRKARHVLNENNWRAFPAIEIEKGLSQSVTDEEFFATVFSYQCESRYAYVVLSLLYSNLTHEYVRYDLDHLHPKALFDKDKHDWNEYNSILNLQLLSESENRSKGKRSLYDWVSQETQSKDYESFLENHLIPNTNLSLDNFSKFVEQRKQLLTEKLKELL